jgi:phosphoglycerate dehydrogenase-like enzyme
MTFTMVMVPPHQNGTQAWPQRLARAIPSLRVRRPQTLAQTVEVLQDADAVYGALPEELLAHAQRLKWLQAPQAGPPPGFYHPALVAHPVQVTNMRDTYTDHVAAHTLALILAMARGLPGYVRAQQRSTWAPDWNPGSVLALSEAKALVVGVGAVGAEIGRLLASFGTQVMGVDARTTGPVKGFTDVLPPGELDAQLGEADVVVLTVPHTPQTEGMINAERLAKLRSTAYFVNVGRGPTVHLGALVDALDQGHLAGVALDVFDEEPLPPGHPLWQHPKVLITPHVAGAGPHADERRFAVLLENARRFTSGRPLVNVVDKSNWF